VDRMQDMANSSSERSGPLAKRYMRQSYHTAGPVDSEDTSSRKSRVSKAGCTFTSQLDAAKDEAKALRMQKSMDRKKTKLGTSDSIKSKSRDDLEPGTRCRGCRTVAYKIVKNPSFDIVSGVFVLLNALLIGAETEYMTYHGGRSHDGFIFSQVFLNIWFTIELVLRITADNFRFLSSPDWKWNIFDSVLVCFSLVDVLLQFALVGVQGFMRTGRLMRIIRLSRVVRTLRLCRTLNYIHQFRKMVYSLQASVTTLLWSLLLLFAVIFAFSLMFVQGTAEYLADWDEVRIPAGDVVPPHVGTLRVAYGSFVKASITLYKAISNGESWGNLMDPLESIDSLYVAMFLIYISISFFGVLNVVSAVFVESAMASAAHYKDLRIYESRQAKTELARHMKEVFRQIDEDESGEISFAEMDHFLTDPQLKMYVESLEVTVEDTAMLFQLMDQDDSGVVDIEEFCTGLMRLQGDARSFDVHLLIFEMSKFQNRWDKFVRYVEFMFDEVIEVMASQDFEQHAEGGRGAAAERLNSLRGRHSMAGLYVSEDPEALTQRQSARHIFDRNADVVARDEI